MRFSLQTGLNLIALYGILFWSKLVYWCMEGKMPSGWVAGSFLFIALLVLGGNWWLIEKARPHRVRAVLIALACLILFKIDPFILPRYMDWMNDYTMHLSIRILTYIKS